MRLLKVLPSSAIRSVTFNVEANPAVYGGNAVRAINARYGFLESPQRLADFDYDAGVKFLRGNFEGHIVDLQIFLRGIKAYSADGTTVCDAFIDDFIGATKAAGVEVDTSSLFRAYSSAIEVEFLGKFDTLFTKMSGFSKLVGSKIVSYGGPNDEFRGVGISFVGSLEGPAPDPFRLERRVGHAWDSHTFFSLAPLSTDDHIETLTELEKLIS
ncbi:hypothetical protein [Mesorhizobium sp. M0590]|uniref:hypothetical protein n=1 Tax=Mesorhizobium sp. M0590 TaxID=2956966 RepID=UPI00333DAE20